MSTETRLTLRDKKNARVSIPVGRKYIGYQPTAEILYSPSGRDPELRVIRKIYIDGLLVEDAIETLKKESEGLTKARIEIDSYNDYGDHRTDIDIIGYRSATDEEIKKAERKLLSDKKERIEKDQIKDEMEVKKAEEILRKKKPELLKEM